MEFKSMLMEYEYQKKDAEYFQNVRQEMLDFIPFSSKTILDVGCGGGNFGKYLKEERNVEVWGVELDKDAASIAAQKLDKVICAAFTNSLDLPKSNFDCIVFNDVLEHMVDPYSALVYAKEILNKQGVVVASIPNVRYFDNIWNLLVKKNWEYSDWGILDKTHLRFFTKRSIISTFENLGYYVECIESINPLEKIHPRLVKRFNFLNIILLNKIEDMRYLQFAVVARPKN
ncbi:class I SAM-dependent methyltransferase [Nostoc sp. 106C]|uniref:class I SAM-dependent methyltransferase n=1 Tax=Nostoc sp. 106C TaxID=1932667 RepID=UPI001AA14316|nr:class I SAM-dependent methyltransferase [Nostoc sp. 106C]